MCSKKLVLQWITSCTSCKKEDFWHIIIKYRHFIVNKDLADMSQKTYISKGYFWGRVKFDMNGMSYRLTLYGKIKNKKAIWKRRNSNEAFQNQHIEGLPKVKFENL